MKPQPFLIGINMPGAVSAGAYTAGVLDFLIEALDAWYDAKAAGKAVPMHDVSIEVFSGASAGGMCAAIASVMLQGAFEHIHDPNKTGTTNKFYESWVNKIDIRELLKTDDIRKGGHLVSLLDCGIIDEIAEYALHPVAAPQKPPYISDRLTLFLTLTNVTGIPYSFPDKSTGLGVLREGTLHHADRLRFETVKPGQDSSMPIAKRLPVGQVAEKPDAGAWGLLREAAKATGAFPIFLAPRILTRETADYDIPMWLSINPSLQQKGQIIPPAWPSNTDTTIETLNVDGGVIDNDPFNLAHDHLAYLNYERKRRDRQAVASETATADEDPNQNPREPEEADAAVISISPFPATFFFKEASAKDADVTKAIADLASVLVAQSRFFGESLAVIASGTASRYMIAPSDNHLGPDEPTLQCGTLGAFGGFFERSFRAHDFMLGRRNCQQFLRTQFVLPEGNAIIQDGLARMGPSQRAEYENNLDKNGRKKGWYPIIPLCTEELRKKMKDPPARGVLSRKDLKNIVNAIYERFESLAPALTDRIAAAGPRTVLGFAECVIGLVRLGRRKLTEIIAKELGKSFQER